MKNQKVFIIFLLISVLINFTLTMYLYKPKRIAILDLQNIKEEYTQLLVNKEDKVKEEYIKNFSTKVNKLIIKVSEENNIIIIPKQVIFAGWHIDLTEQFKEVLLYDIKKD